MQAEKIAKLSCIFLSFRLFPFSKVFPTIFQNNRIISDKLNTFQIQLLIDDIINKDFFNGIQIKTKTTRYS